MADIQSQRLGLPFGALFGSPSELEFLVMQISTEAPPIGHRKVGPKEHKKLFQKASGNKDCAV